MANFELPGPDVDGCVDWYKKELTDAELERALQELPEEEAEQAVELYADENQFEELPAVVTRLRNLDWLVCGQSDHLMRLSPALFKLIKMTGLYCCESPRFVSIPSSCTALTNLEALDLSDTALPAYLAIDLFYTNHDSVQLHLRLLAIHRLKPARAVARTLLLTRRFRETKLTFVNLDCVKMICQMIIEDGDSVDWEPLLERK